MLVGELLCQVAERDTDLHQDKSEVSLQSSSPGALSPGLVAELKERKIEILRPLKEDEQFRRTGVIPSERRVFDMAHEYFSLTKKRDDA